MNTMKKLIRLLIIFTIFFSIILPSHAVTINSPSLTGIQIFPKDHIYNTRVDNLPVDSKSDIYITQLKKDTERFTGLNHYISTAIPYNVVTSTEPRQYITRFVYAPYSDDIAYPIPDNPLIEQGSNDHHMELIDVDEMVLYELYAAEKLSDGSWGAGLGAVWDLKGYTFRKNNATPMWSANEAGLPHFSGLIRYDEVSAGHIDHALMLSIPAMQNTWIWPARSAQVNDPPNPTHPPAGQRFRLKESYDISGFPPQAKVILQALKTYGAITATNSGADNPVSVIGSPDSRWNYTDLDTLTRVDLSNFEAVDVSSVIIDQNSAQARQIPVVEPTSPSAPIPENTVKPDIGILDMAIPVACIGIAAICCVGYFLRKK